LFAAECSYADGNGSVASISSALGKFQVGWKRWVDTDLVIESIQEIVSKINEAERELFPLSDVLIDGLGH
jgi:hypothetical protein